MTLLKNFTASKAMCLLLALAMVVSMTACGRRTAPEDENKEPEDNKTEEFENPLDKKDDIKDDKKDDKKEEPKVETPKLGDKIAEIKAKNNDVVGWLQIPDTEINAAVVQATNNDFYMRKNELKEYSWTGSYFVDYECAMGNTRDDLFRSTIIYGHNVNYDDAKDKERFSQLFHFADKDFAQKHPYIYFSTPQDDMVWEIFAVTYTTTDFDYVQVLRDRKTSPDQITEAQMMNIVNGAKERSEFVYDVNVTGSDKILTLSTCSYKYGRRSDVRFIVMGKLLPKDAVLKESITLTENTAKKEVQ